MHASRLTTLEGLRLFICAHREALRDQANVPQAPLDERLACATPLFAYKRFDDMMAALKSFHLRSFGLLDALETLAQFGDGANNLYLVHVHCEDNNGQSNLQPVFVAAPDGDVAKSFAFAYAQSILSDFRPGLVCELRHTPQLLPNPLRPLIPR